MKPEIVAALLHLLEARVQIACAFRDASVVSSSALDGHVIQLGVEAFGS